MLLVIAAVVLVVSVPLAGGKLSRLADLKLHAVWAVMLAAAIQVGITTVVRGGSHEIHVVLHVLSYLLVAWFLIANRRLAGMPLLAVGAGLNMLAIAVNGGVMPASAWAVKTSGIDTSGGFDNSATVAHAHLQLLGDVIPVPGPWPIGNVLSGGDLIIFVGAFLVLHHACRTFGSRWTPRDMSPPEAGAAGVSCTLESRSTTSGLSRSSAPAAESTPF